MVHYAAFAAVRSAIVWIPASLETGEASNCISLYNVDFEAKDQVYPVLDPADPAYGPKAGGMTFLIEEGSPKFAKIKLAAILATTPISPMRDYGYGLNEWASNADALKAAYAALAPSSYSNYYSAVAERIDAKLAYALNNTDVKVRFYHKNVEPPLLPYTSEMENGFKKKYFQENELGWQDLVTVTVSYNMALLPCAGKLFADRPGVTNQGKVYCKALTATAALNVEGEKSVISYVY